MSAVQRVLIIKLSAIGDILHALPVSAALGEAYPHLEISWAVETPFATLLEGNPYLKEVLAVPKLRGKTLRTASSRRDYLERLRGVRSRQFDLTLDLQGLTKSALIAWAARPRRRLGYHWLREAARWVEQPIPRRPESVHIVDQYLDVARFLGANPQKVRFPFAISEAEEAAVTALLCEAGLEPDTPFVAINPASALEIKQWGAPRYAALMDTLRSEYGLPSVLVTADQKVAAEVAEAARQPFVNLTGRTTLKQLGAVLRRCAAHVCGDTGSGHLAAACERPVVSLIGPTDPDRACPYGQRDNVIVHREACDSGCNWHHCRFTAPRCMAAIAVEEVAAKVQTLLSPAQVK
jgi:heptosyltransferase-1